MKFSGLAWEAENFGCGIEYRLLEWEVDGPTEVLNISDVTIITVWEAGDWAAHQ